MLILTSKKLNSKNYRIGEESRNRSPQKFVNPVRTERTATKKNLISLERKKRKKLPTLSARTGNSPLEDEAGCTV